METEAKFSRIDGTINPKTGIHFPDFIPKNPTVRLYPESYGVQVFISHTEPGRLPDICGLIGDLDAIQDFLQDALSFVRSINSHD